MGVSGLLTYCLEHRAQCCDEYDLIEIARSRGLIEILVDYYAFQNLIINKLWRGLGELRKNPFLRIIGAEYSTLDAFISKLIADLKSLGIRLVFFVDGARGSSTASDQKLDTWINRFKQDLNGCKDLLDVCRDMRNIFDVPESSTCRPVLVEPQIFKTLKRCECEVIQCPFGEADFIIARALIEREQAFAVLSNDSDFCIFKGCRFIPHNLFDLQNDLQLGQPSCLSEKPLHLYVSVISSDKVQKLMEFPDQEHLIELSIVGGNDFTKEYMRKRGKPDLIHQIGIQGCIQIPGIVGWVKRYSRVENHPTLRDFIHKNPGFKRAVEHSRSFYSLTEAVDQPIKIGPATNIILDGIREGLFSPHIMAMHSNFYWQRLLLEDDTPGYPGVEIVLTELRSFIYRIVLAHQDNRVKEYVKNPEGKLVPVMINAADRRLNTPSITYIMRDKVFQNLRFFHQVFSHQEQGREMNFFDRYGRKNGFICYVLRYFLILNWGRNLCLTRDEFFALVAVTFGQLSEDQYQQYSLQPTVRCVTIANWFQDVYRHGCLFLGQLLYLSHEFPEPREMFCGSAWTVFHTCAEGEAWNRAMQRFRQEDFQQAQQHMNSIIRKKRHVIPHIVEGVFEYNNRW